MTFIPYREKPWSHRNLFLHATCMRVCLWSISLCIPLCVLESACVSVLGGGDGGLCVVASLFVFRGQMGSYHRPVPNQIVAHVP